MAKRFISILICLLAVLQSLSCTPLTTDDVLTNGASQFGQGRDEQDYHLDTSGKLLADLIDNYADSYYHPTVSEMTDDEFEDLFGKKDKKNTEDDSEKPSEKASEKASEETSEDTSQSPSQDPDEDTSEIVRDEIKMVASMEDLKRACLEAYRNTDETMEFELINSFTFKSDDLVWIYVDLQNQDPVSASGVYSFSMYTLANQVYIQIHYNFDVDELKNMKKQTYQLVAQAAKEINAYGLDDCTIVCNVNDYLCDNTYYPDAHPTDPPYDPVTHTAYGCLNDGCAVCEGYACATKLLLNEFGVECQIEVGDCYDGGPHAWNLAKVEGDWYQLDVTWNDGSQTDNYLLVTDDYMKQTRAWDYDKYPKTPNKPYDTGR